jgi:hypothetical protein
MTHAFKSRHPGAFKIGTEVSDLAQSGYAFGAISVIAKNPKIDDIVPPAPVGKGVQGLLERVDGTPHSFDVRHYLDRAMNHDLARDEVMKAWCTAALIAANVHLEPKGHFREANANGSDVPEFELIYHLRNGMAHGNKFNFRKSGIDRLNDHPAYLRFYDGSEKFNISLQLKNQPILFDFLGPGDVVDILVLVAERLKDLERGKFGPGVDTSIFG